MADKNKDKKIIVTTNARPPAAQDIPGVGVTRTGWYDHNMIVAGMPKGDDTWKTPKWPIPTADKEMPEERGDSGYKLFPNNTIIGYPPVIYDILIDEINGREIDIDHINEQLDESVVAADVQLAFGKMYEEIEKAIATGRAKLRQQAPVIPYWPSLVQDVVRTDNSQVKLQQEFDEENGNRAYVRQKINAINHFQDQADDLSQKELENAAEIWEIQQQEASYPTQDALKPNNSKAKLQQAHDHKPPKKPEITILDSDIFGRAHNGTESDVRATINYINTEYIVAVGENIAGGPFGAAGYMTGGDKGSFAGAQIDAAAAAAIALNSFEPVNPAESQYVPSTELPFTYEEPTKAPTIYRGWRVGDPITNLTFKGKIPVWGTVRQRSWKNEAFNYPNNEHKQSDLFRIRNGLPPLILEYDETDLLRMRKGLAPQRINPFTGELESMELHHDKTPQREGDVFNFVILTQDEHRLHDDHRH